VQYFRRNSCAACGSNELADKRASARDCLRDSLVARAATPETRAHVPTTSCWSIPRSFRMMAHGDRDLAIGDRVNARFAPFAGRLVLIWKAKILKG